MSLFTITEVEVVKPKNLDVNEKQTQGRTDTLGLSITLFKFFNMLVSSSTALELFL